MRQTSIVIFAVLLLAMVSLSGREACGAIGCALDNPDQDIRFLFPQSTSYRTLYVQIDQRGGQPLYRRVMELLRDKLDGIYETIDVPYTYYLIYKGGTQIGYIHGINQKGKYGGMQIFIAMDMTGKILNLYYQKLSSPEASVFRSEQFKKQLVGITLADYYKHDYYKTSEKYAKLDRIARIRDLSRESSEDFRNSLRGIRKNLILTDQFFLGKIYDAHFLKSQELLKRKG